MNKNGRPITNVPFECTAEGCSTMLTPTPKRKGTMCKPCLDASRKLPERFCSECGVPIGRDVKKSPMGFCRKHANKVGVSIEKRRAAALRLHADPNYVEKRRPILEEAQRRRMADPVQRAAAQAVMRKTGLQWGGSAKTKRDQKLIQWKSRNTKLADIPLAYRDEYVALTRHHLPAPERKRIILDQVAAVTSRHHKPKD
jgi:hypothetical protein